SLSLPDTITLPEPLATNRPELSKSMRLLFPHPLDSTFILSLAGTKNDYWATPRLAAGTKPMGFPKGRSGSSSLWSTTGFKPRGRYNLIKKIDEGAQPRLVISFR
ncbi:MAG: hypothetical protein V3U06_10610, partial [Candidatus Binatia bacterium]